MARIYHRRFRDVHVGWLRHDMSKPELRINISVPVAPDDGKAVAVGVS